MNSLYQSYPRDASSANATLGTQMMNDGLRIVLSKHQWPFLFKTKTADTVASQQFYPTPYDATVPINLTISKGTTITYSPLEITSRQDWDRLNMSTGISSDIPQWYYVFGDKVGIWPKPSSGTTGAITFNYKKQVKDLSIADYSTGSISTATTGSTTIVGSSTVFTSQMNGSYLRITDSQSTNKGDGFWYEIADVQSGTTLVLTKNYGGATITAGSAAYVVGQMPMLPEDYHILPVWYALWQYWGINKDDAQKGVLLKAQFDEGVKSMEQTYLSPSANPVVDYGERRFQGNPNNYITF